MQCNFFLSGLWRSKRMIVVYERSMRRSTHCSVAERPETQSLGFDFFLRFLLLTHVGEKTYKRVR